MRAAALSRSLTRTGPLVLVNRSHPLEAARPDLVPAAGDDGRVLLERRAAGLLCACIRAVGGVSRIVPVSGWRSRQEQQQIWDDALRDHGPDFTRQFVAYPGCSEHQTGLAIDLGEAAEHIDFLCPAFPDDGVCGAFRRAAARYGFIQRYRREKEALTGIAEEPWHFRYVGAPHALLMEQTGLCLEEYLDYVRHRPRQAEMPGGRRATVSYLPCDGDVTEARLPDGCCQISGDNDGGFLLTVWETAS